MDEPTTQTVQPLPAADAHTGELAKLEQLVQQHLDGWKRAKADYLNLKKQSDKEKQDIAQFVQAATVLEILPIYDNLIRSIRHIPDEYHGADWVKGIGHIVKQFQDTLKQFGLQPIPAVGQPFDPNLHHAVSKVPDGGQPTGTIVEELKTGWRSGDRVIQPSDVVVAE